MTLFNALSLTHLAFVAICSFTTAFGTCAIDMMTGFTITTVTTRKRALQSVSQSVTFYKIFIQNKIKYRISKKNIENVIYAFLARLFSSLKFCIAKNMTA